MVKPLKDKIRREYYTLDQRTSIYITEFRLVCLQIIVPAVGVDTGEPAGAGDTGEAGGVGVVLGGASGGRG